MQTFKIPQIVSVTDTIIKRSKWDSGIWKPESRMAEEGEVLSGGKEEMQSFRSRPGSFIFSLVIPLDPVSLAWFYYPSLFSVSPLPAPHLCHLLSPVTVHILFD